MDGLTLPEWKYIDVLKIEDAFIKEAIKGFVDRNGDTSSADEVASLIRRFNSLSSHTEGLHALLYAVEFLRSCASIKLPSVIFPDDEYLPKHDELDIFVRDWWLEHYEPCAKIGILTTTFMRKHDLRYEGRLRRVLVRAGDQYFDGAKSIAELIRSTSDGKEFVDAIKLITEIDDDDDTIIGSRYRRRPNSGGAARSIRRG